jgi:hypothetical protein
MSKPKPVNWELIESTELYTLVSDLISKYHRGQGESDLTSLSFVLMWRHNIKPDRDNYIVLSDVSKSSDKMRELRPHDVVIGINKDAWESMSNSDKCVVIDSQLERVAVCLDKEGNPKEDEQSRIIYRLRRQEALTGLADGRAHDDTMTRRHGKTLSEVHQSVLDKLFADKIEQNSYVDTQMKG